MNAEREGRRTERRMFSALWRKRIVSVGIPCPNPAVAAMNEKFGALFSGEFPRGIDRFPLGAMNGARLPATSAADRPSASVWHNMLVSLDHRTPP